MGRTIVIAVAAVAVIAAGLVAIPALAQDDAEAPKAQHHEAFIEALADELDLPVDRVREAVEAAREQVRNDLFERHLGQLEERLNAAVEAGRLTREQADAILDAMRNGVLPLGGRGGHRHGHGPGLWRIDPAPEGTST